MKWLYILPAALLLMVITSGCEVTPGYGGASVGVYGEYPATYSGDYYNPGYPYGTVYWDHNHYWDHGHWERHPSHYRFGGDHHVGGVVRGGGHYGIRHDGHHH
jgi:hypothetical protein